eukprot:5633279-Amphidinium_carterae.1
MVGAPSDLTYPMLPFSPRPELQGTPGGVGAMLGDQSNAPSSGGLPTEPDSNICLGRLGDGRPKMP